MKRNTQLISFCLILFGGIVAGVLPVQVPDGVDKLCHFVGFSLLTVFAISTYIAYFGKKHIDQFLVFLLTFGAFFAGVSEFMQKFVAVRSCDVYDWMTNLLGITVVVLVAFLNISKERKKAEIADSRFDCGDLPFVF